MQEILYPNQDLLTSSWFQSWSISHLLVGIWPKYFQNHHKVQWSRSRPIKQVDVTCHSTFRLGKYNCTEINKFLFSEFHNKLRCLHSKWTKLPLYLLNWYSLTTHLSCHLISKSFKVLTGQLHCTSFWSKRHDFNKNCYMPKYNLHHVSTTKL